jgi:hypothetical protein
MLVKSRLMFRELGREQRKLLLLLGHNRQQSHEGVLDQGRRGCPIISRDYHSGWCRLPGDSMASVVTAVKSERVSPPDNGSKNGYDFIPMM